MSDPEHAPDEVDAVEAIEVRDSDPEDPAPKSGRASLRAQREDATSGLHIDLKVPEYVDVYVRYSPVSAPTVRKKMRKYDSDRDSGLLKAYAELLIESCLGIFHVTEENKEVSVDPDAPDQWPGYGARLAQILELDDDEASSAISVLRAFHVKDGHVYSLAGKLMEFSGFARGEIEERMRGN